MSEINEAFDKWFIMGDEEVDIAEDAFFAGFTAGVESVLKKRCSGCGRYPCAITGLMDGEESEDGYCHGWEKRNEPTL